MNREIVIKQERRPCYFLLRGSKELAKGMFHQWVNKVSQTSEGNEKHQICALVETESGLMMMIPAEVIKFTDHSEFREYYWPGEDKDEH